MKDLGVVWLACAVTVLAGLVWAFGHWHEPFDVGSLGQWASAIGTVSAVYVALFNTVRTLNRTERRDAEKKAEADLLWLSALLVFAKEILSAITETQNFLANGTVRSAGLKNWIHVVGIDGIVRSLDRLPVHQAPDPQAIRLMTYARVAGANLDRRLAEAVDANSSVGVRLIDELDLITGIVGILEAMILRRSV